MKEETKMNRSEYLRILSERITSLPRDEYNNIMEYYTEYFEEAGEGNDEKVIEELGRPEALAEKIISESTDKNVQGNMGYNAGTDQSCNPEIGMVYNQKVPDYYPQPEKAGLSTGWKVFILIITFPIWIGIVAAIGGVIFGFCAAMIACIGAGIATLVAGLAVVATSSGASLLFIGGGFLAITVALCLLMAVVGMGTGIVKFIKWLFGNKTEKKSTI